MKTKNGLILRLEVRYNGAYFMAQKKRYKRY